VREAVTIARRVAVVDGASQGLTLIDLRAVTLARAPYF